VYFLGNVRSRGAGYAADGHVTRLTVRRDAVKAVVEGSENYDVYIKRYLQKGGWDLAVGCTCPFAEENDGRCKHLWATLLQAEAQIEKAWGVPPKEVMVFNGNAEHDDEFDDGFDEDESDGPGGLRINILGGVSHGVLDVRGINSIADLRSKVMQLVHGAGPRSPKAIEQPKKPKVPAWKRMLEETRPEHRGYYGYEVVKSKGPISGSIWYVIDEEKSCFNNAIVMELMRRKERGGESESPAALEKLVKLTIIADDIEHIENPDDRWICALLVGAARPGRETSAYSFYRRNDQRAAHWQLDPKLMSVVMPRLMGTGRLLWRKSQDHLPEPASWVPDSPWELALALLPESDAPDAKASLRPMLRRGKDGTEAVAFSDIRLMTEGDPGAVMHRGEIAPLHVAGGRAGGLLLWARDVAHRQPTLVDQEEIASLLDGLSAKKVGLPMVWPENWGPKRMAGVLARPRLHLTTPKSSVYDRSPNHLQAKVGFEYEGVVVESDVGVFVCVKLADGTAAMVQRDVNAERLASERFLELGGRRDAYNNGSFEVPFNRVPVVVAGLLGEGWHVVRDAATYRKPGAVNVRVTSGIDWFDLEGAAEFEGSSASIGDVLTALQKGERFVSLGDGSLGLLPDEWLSKYGRWLGLGRAEGDSVRFGRAQLSLVDALMEEMPEATCDKQVAAARAKLSAFAGIVPRTEPRSFRGELRPYQRQGLGWLHFLAEFGLGGCLADDMGLGKTVQLLAHLADRRKKSDKGPWLVVAPKSLVLNWAKEAERFTPKLSVMDYTGPERTSLRDKLVSTDLVLTTYATMRLDIEVLREIEFGCVVLDEAQMIKNATSQAAKAARLLKASRRLALTGTPVENRLEDLWSIFEFLNPGMLGSTKAFQTAARGGEDEGGMEMLRRALRPFLLRRTKAMVAAELPSRTEQTVRCQLEGKQKTLYEGLRKHYQEQLLGRVDREGMNKSKMHVLEALLRLRQAACHPALIEPKSAPTNGRTKKTSGSQAESAKMVTLMAMLEELAGEGNKALVFSQFTSLLALVRTELDRKGITYEELDGSTSSKDRAERVERFQSTSLKDGGRPVFLISLKAGGVGLNLTAAGYVFLLDPWWNPAVEAQAIDRTHRIGQDKSVIAYRLIATGTVEERILELQERKRELASAIISENAGPLSAMTRDDLEWLLS